MELSVEVCCASISSLVQLYTLQRNCLTGAKGLLRVLKNYCSGINLQTQQISSLFLCLLGVVTCFCVLLLSLSSLLHVYTPSPFFKSSL